MTDFAFGDDGIGRLRNLLVASSRGEQAAFAELYDLTKGKLFGVALTILRRPDVAEEILQEAYIRIWQKAGQYDPALASPITWMVTIVRNLAIDFLRRPILSTGGSDESLLLTLPSEQESALEGMQACEERGRAFTALRALNPVQRTLIVAAYVHGESREQLALRFGKPANTIKTWLRRALLEARMSMSNAMGVY
jgi:RNA polymerase sigma-70 factor (ECF subfamily)